MRTPRRVTGRISTFGERRLGRLIEGQVDSGVVYGDTIAPGPDGRLEVVQSEVLRGVTMGDPNHPLMERQADLLSTASTADIINKVNDILRQLRNTQRMR